MNAAIKLCKDCKFSIDDKSSSWSLRCVNLQVNKNDHWCLSDKEFNGTSCREEREHTFFRACGKKGKQWEPKQ